MDHSRQLSRYRSAGVISIHSRDSSSRSGKIRSSVDSLIAA